MMSAYRWTVVALLAWALVGCGVLADRREARQTDQADPAGLATPGPSLGGETASATPAADAPQTVTLATPTTAVEAGVSSPTATVAAPLTLPTATSNAAVPDAAGDELMTLLDQLGSELEAEDGGVESKLP